MTRFVEHHFCSECNEAFRTNKQLQMHSSHKHKGDVTPSIRSDSQTDQFYSKGSATESMSGE